MWCMICLMAIGYADPAAQSKTIKAEVAPPPRAKRVSPQVLDVVSYSGEIVFLTDDVISINGTEGVAKKAIRSFPVGICLKKGEQDPREAVSWNYRLVDLKVGDVVMIMLQEEKGQATCVAVRLYRRPGGLVPKAPFEDSDTRDPHHARMNAFQAFEERGVPLPLKYDPAYQKHLSELALADERRMRKRLEANEREIYLREHTAPEPRPIYRKWPADGVSESAFLSTVNGSIMATNRPRR